jgi:MFS family permease
MSLGPRFPVYALLASSTLSTLAEAVSMVAIPWFVLELTGSYEKMGLIGFITVLPRVIATFLGGQVVDRIGFRTSAELSDVLSGLSICGIPLLYASGNLSFPVLIALVFAGAFFDGPGTTAREAMVPELAEQAEIPLDRVNSYYQSARRLSIFIGPALAGALIGIVGPSNVLWANALFFALSLSVLLLCVPDLGQSVREQSAQGSFVANTLFGWRFLRRNPLMLWLAGLICVMNFLDAPLATVQLPALVHSQGGSAAQLGLLLSVDGAGAVVGAVTFAAAGARFARRSIFVPGFFVIGVGMLLVAFAPNFPMLLLILFAMGFASGPLNPILMSVRQERVPVEYRARVFGTLVAIAMVAIPLGQLAGGLAVQRLGPQRCIAAIAWIYLVMVVSLLLNPVFREMNVRPRPSETPVKPATRYPKISSPSGACWQRSRPGCTHPADPASHRTPGRR